MKTVFLAFSLRNTSVTDFFLTLANRLAKEYKVVIFADSIQKHPFSISPSIEVISWKLGRLNSLKSTFILNGLVKKHKPITMIANFRGVWPFVLIGFLNGTKNRIAWCHSISNQFLAHRPLIDKKKFLYKLSTAVFANSLATREDLIQNFNVDQRKIEVFYNAVRECSNNEKSDQLQLLYVGRMHPSKGVDVLLKAMPDVIKRFPEIKLKLVGGRLIDKEVIAYKKMAADLGIENNVIFCGGKSKEGVMEEFSKSWITIVPSFVEAFGYVVIESFSVKTPVIGANTSGIAEIIRNGKDGYLFESGNSNDLSIKIIRLLTDHSLRNELGLNCYSRFKEHFEINAVINKIVDKLNSKITE